VGLLAAPGLAHDLATELAAELPAWLRDRFPGVDWTVAVSADPLVGAAGASEDLVQIARRRQLTGGWRLVVCLADLPLRVGRRPVTAHASAALGVAVVSVPALGAIDVASRVREIVPRLLDGPLHEDLAAGARASRGRRTRRLRVLSSPIGRADARDERTVPFVTAAVRGNVGLLAGMVRANRPWRLVTGLSRALVAALGTAAFGLTSPGVWRIADGAGPLRLALLSTASVLAICVTLVVAHELWERDPGAEIEARERVVLGNLATSVTVGAGVATQYLALLVICVAGSAVLIAPPVLAAELRHAVGLADYARLAWLVSSLATIGGALGAAVESDTAVREAAYGYRVPRGGP
jgi:hypothetical protein